MHSRIMTCILLQYLSITSNSTKDLTVTD